MERAGPQTVLPVKAGTFTGLKRTEGMRRLAVGVVAVVVKEYRNKLILRGYTLRTLYKDEDFKTEICKYLK